MANRRGKLGFKITVDSDCSHEIKRYLLLGRKAMMHLDSVLKSRDITLLTKVLYSLKLFSSLVQIWELDYKEGWVLKYSCFQSEKTLEKTDWIKPVSPKRNQPWIFIGRTDAEAEAQIVWAPAIKSQFIGKDPAAGKDWRLKEKRAAKDEMVRWHHRFNVHEFEQTLRDSEW